jgi:competence protein ComEC
MGTAAEPDALRKQLDGRPLLVLAAGLIVGLTAPAHPWNLLAILVAIAVLFRPSMRVLLGFGLLSGLILAPAEPIPVLDRGYGDFVGAVVSLPRPTDFGSVFNLETGDRTWRVLTSDPTEFSIGDRLQVAGIEEPLREGTDRYLLLHGVSGRLDALHLRLVSHGPIVWRAARAWRADFRTFCRRWLATEGAAFIEALCFDLNAGVDHAVTDRLKDMGALHIVVASGFHVLLIAAALLSVLARLPLPRVYQIAIVAFVLLLYCGATGLTPAVVRSSLMVVTGLSAYLFRREPDALSALGLSAVMYLCWHPREVYDPGFQLSFLTVGVIALFYHPLRRERNRFMRVSYDLAVLSWIAFLGSAPLMAYYFGALSVVSLPASLLVSAAAGAAIVGAFAAYVVSFMIPSLGVGLLNVIAAPMAGWVLWVSDHLGGHSWSSVAVPAFSAYWLVLIYGLMLLTWRVRIVQP